MLGQSAGGFKSLNFPGRFSAPSGSASAFGLSAFGLPSSLNSSVNRPSPYGSSLAEPVSIEPVSIEPIDLDIESSQQASGTADYFDDTWQLAPDGLIYHSYLAGLRESRIGNQWISEKDDGSLWDVSLGGRVGLLRYGTLDSLEPEGWQLDIEGAAFPRLDPRNNMDLRSVDFRFGIPLTYGRGPWQLKLAYYHLSSHLGDEYIFRNNITTRFNYSRDAFVLGGSYYLNSNVRLYAEADWAFYSDVSEPWAFQFGAEYSPRHYSGWHGTPFFAVNAHLREEVNFSGNVVVQAGWQWRGQSGHLVRTGFQYYNGLSNQYSFFNQAEEQIGGGIWYDF